MNKNMKTQYENEFVEQLGIGDPTTCVYQLIYNEKESVDTETNKIFYYEWIGVMYQGR